MDPGNRVYFYEISCDSVVLVANNNVKVNPFHNGRNFTVVSGRTPYNEIKGCSYFCSPPECLQSGEEHIWEKREVYQFGLLAYQLFLNKTKEDLLTLVTDWAENHKMDKAKYTDTRRIMIQEIQRVPFTNIPGIKVAEAISTCLLACPGARPNLKSLKANLLGKPMQHRSGSTV